MKNIFFFIFVESELIVHAYNNLLTKFCLKSQKAGSVITMKNFYFPYAVLRNTLQDVLVHINMINTLTRESGCHMCVYLGNHKPANANEQRDKYCHGEHRA